MTEVKIIYFFIWLFFSNPYCKLYYFFCNVSNDYINSIYTVLIKTKSLIKEIYRQRSTFLIKPYTAIRRTPLHSLHRYYLVRKLLMLTDPW